MPEPPISQGGAEFDVIEALEELLQHLVVLARHTVPGADSVSITVVDGDGFRTANFTGKEALALDEAQYEGDGGPCLEALRSRSQLQVAIGAEEHRWPAFEQRARELGVGAVLSTALLRAPGEAIGALNIYACHRGSFSQAERRPAEIIAEHAGILVGALLSAAQLNEQLRQAVASREIIGQATGIIMQAEGRSRDEAFDVLRRASQRQNRKLREVSEELVLRVEASAQDTQPEGDQPGP